MICQECSERKTCQELCPEAELFVNQDYIPQTELTIGFDITSYIEFPAFTTSIHLTPREKEIVTLLGKGLSRKDVCQLLIIKPHTVRNHIKRIKKKWLK